MITRPCGNARGAQATAIGRSGSTSSPSIEAAPPIPLATKSIRRFCRHRPAESHPGRYWRGRSREEQDRLGNLLRRGRTPGRRLRRELLQHVAHCRRAFGAGRSGTDRIDADALGPIFGCPRPEATVLKFWSELQDRLGIGGSSVGLPPGERPSTGAHRQHPSERAGLGEVRGRRVRSLPLDEGTRSLWRRRHARNDRPVFGADGSFSGPMEIRSP
jgi:hypothetical protein